MKHFYKLFALLFTATFFLNCSDDSNMGISSIEEPVVTKSFAEDDGSTDLSERSTGYKVYKLLHTAGPEFGSSLGSINITNEQYDEIKNFTDKLVATCTTDEEKHKIVFDWLYANIKHGNADNDPYPVFINKKGVCQGYSNLMKVMLHSQGIPCVLTNGFLNPIGGHAWCNVYYNNTWISSDPTNHTYFIASKYSMYTQYDPTSLDGALFEDEYCTYNYTEGALNVQSIKEGVESVSIPFSAGGYKVSMLSPSLPVPSSVKELYVGANITSFGENIKGLVAQSKTIEKIHIDPENEIFESFSAGVYYKNRTGDNLALVAPGAKHLELKAIVDFDKESKLKDLPYLETITFVPGTMVIGAWAVERCPMLHTAYIPQETNVSSSAFSLVSYNFKIVRGNYTNIPQIKF